MPRRKGIRKTFKSRHPLRLQMKTTSQVEGATYRCYISYTGKGSFFFIYSRRTIQPTARRRCVREISFKISPGVLRPPDRQPSPFALRVDPTYFICGSVKGTPSSSVVHPYTYMLIMFCVYVGELRGETWVVLKYDIWGVYLGDASGKYAVAERFKERFYAHVWHNNGNKFQISPSLRTDLRRGFSGWNNLRFNERRDGDSGRYCV